MMIIRLIACKIINMYFDNSYIIVDTLQAKKYVITIMHSI